MQIGKPLRTFVVDFAVVFSSDRARHGRAALQGVCLPENVADQRLRILNPCAHCFGEADWDHGGAYSRPSILRPQQVVR
jgi:hypothetical protein